MKDAFALVIMSILSFACTGPATTEIELTPELKNWEPAIGKWSSEIETRDNPTDAWKKGSAIYEVHSGRFFVGFSGTDETEGEERSLTERFGYDPIQRGIVSSLSMSDGTVGGQLMTKQKE